MKAMNQAWKGPGSSSRKIRLNVSWLGIPCGSVRNCSKNSRLARPNNAMSAHVTLPHSTVQSAIPLRPKSYGLASVSAI